MGASLNGVLENDTDAENDSLSAILDSTTSNGELVLNSDGSFVYTPSANFVGTDSFSYHANDSTDDGNTATVTINVDPVNDVPVTVDDEFSTPEDTALTISSPGVLENDTDAENDSKQTDIFDGDHGLIRERL